MTIDEFVEVFREHVRLRDEKWFINISQCLRTDDEFWHCPLSSVANVSICAYHTAGRVLGLGDADSFEIMKAADSFLNHNRKLRAKLLKAANLVEDKR